MKYIGLLALMSTLFTNAWAQEIKSCPIYVMGNTFNFVEYNGNEKPLILNPERILESLKRKHYEPKFAFGSDTAFEWEVDIVKKRFPGTALVKEKEYMAKSANEQSYFLHLHTAFGSLEKYVLSSQGIPGLFTYQEYIAGWFSNTGRWQSHAELIRFVDGLPDCQSTRNSPVIELQRAWEAGYDIRCAEEIPLEICAKAVSETVLPALQTMNIESTKARNRVVFTIGVEFKFYNMNSETKAERWAYHFQSTLTSPRYIREHVLQIPLGATQQEIQRFVTPIAYYLKN